MARSLNAWVMWAISFPCACSAAVPALPVPQPATLGARPTVLVTRPGGYQPVDLSREELKQGMRMLYANGPLPGLPKGRKPQFILASTDPVQMARAAGYLDHCQRITGKRSDWDDLNASSRLDDEGAAFVALHFALSEVLEGAARACANCPKGWTIGESPITSDPSECVRMGRASTILCGPSNRCNLYQCGKGSCPSCPEPNLLFKLWCSYSCSDGSGAAVLHAIGGIPTKMCDIRMHRSCESQ